MNASSPACNSERIEQFLEGELARESLTELERHLDQCPYCNEELQRRTADESFWKDASDFLSGTAVSESVKDTERADLTAAGGSVDDSESNTSESESALAGAPEQEDAGPVSAFQELTFLDPTDDPDMMGRFGGYEISGVVGSGGMGLVLKGWDVALDRFVAIKVLHPSFTGQSASRKRFAREAQAAAAVLHDNVISIYGVDQWKGLPFLVMPYIKGESLQQRIDRTAPLELEDILGISLQIARGLSAAHDQGLVHRDIKPANILMPSSVSRVIITDFGLARTADDASLTRSGVLAGTPQYMSPEQARSQPVDGRTDLFSLGSVMYAMSCGRPPFRGETPYGVLRKITDQPHRPLSQLRPDVPAWFEKIIDRLLAKDPEDRFTSAGELAEHLEDCLAHLRQPTTTLLPAMDLPDAPGGRSSDRRHAGWSVLRWAVVASLGGLVLWGVGHISGMPFNDEAMRRGSSFDQVSSAAVKKPEGTDEGPQPSSESSPLASTRSVPDQSMAWEYDDSQLLELESELKNLLQETAIGPDSADAPFLGEDDETNP